MNIKEIKELVKMLDGTDINELSIESEGNKVVIKKGTNNLPYMNPQFSPMVQFPMTATPVITQGGTAPAAANPAASVQAGEEEKNEGLGPNQVLIIAPMVGTFYRSPSPDAEPYVQVG
ncbi:MAG TPA: hypothetical protein VF531_02990, partial [Bacillota bacterium]